MPDYAELVGTLIRRLVLNPEAVSITQTEDSSGGLLISIKTAKEDIGRVIGKRGSTINAIRLVTKAAAIKSKDRVDVDIDED